MSSLSFAPTGASRTDSRLHPIPPNAKGSTSQPCAVYGYWSRSTPSAPLVMRSLTPFFPASINLKWTPTVAGNYTFTMKALNSADSLIFERSCTIKAYEPSTPFKEQPIALPGILEVEDFDNGANGVAYS